MSPIQTFWAAGPDGRIEVHTFFFLNTATNLLNVYTVSSVIGICVRCKPLESEAHSLA